MKTSPLLSLIALIVGLAPLAARAETPAVPDWAQPGSATHQQVPPPADFHRATRTEQTKIGQFEGQSDIGRAVVEGRSSYDRKAKRYTIESAGYNIWYTRDEFRYLWKKMSGDVSLAADIVLPNTAGYGDRKAVLVIRQDLDDDSKEIMVALHGAGLIHLAERPEKGAPIKEDHRVEASVTHAGAAAAANASTKPVRLGIQKRGDTFVLLVSLHGEPLHQVGPEATLKFNAPFYVGIGFTSHLPATMDVAELSHVVLENRAVAAPF